MSAGNIRAGRAYVELGVDDRTAPGLQSAEAKLRRYQQNAEQLQRQYVRKAATAKELSGGEVPGARTLRQAIEARYAARGQAATMLRELQTQSERAGTLSQQIAGRSALAGRLAAFKAQTQVKSAWNDFAKLQEADARGIAARGFGAGGFGGMGEDDGAMDSRLQVLLGGKAAKFGKFVGAAAVPLAVAALATKAVAVGAQIYQAADSATSGDPEKAAKSAEKVRDTLTDIPIIGSYIGMLTEAWHQKNQQVIKDFEEIRAKSEKVGEALASLTLDRKMAGKDSFGRRQIEVQDQWRKREDEAAQLEVQARGYADDSPEAAAAMAKARAMRQENNAWKERELAKAARDRDERLARQQDALAQAALDGPIDEGTNATSRRSAMMQRQENAYWQLKNRQNAEMRDAQQPGSDVNIELLAATHQQQLTNLEATGAIERKRLTRQEQVEILKERRESAEAVVNASTKGYERERQLLAIKHKAELEEYQSAGRDATELMKRQSAERNGIANREAKDTARVISDLNKQIGLAENPASAKEWAWFDFTQVQLGLGKLKTEIDALRPLWERAFDAGHARKFADSIAAIQLKLSGMTETAQRFRQWQRDNPNATRNEREQMGTLMFKEAAAGELEKLKTPREKLQEYQRAIDEMVTVGVLSKDQAAKLIARADVRSVSELGTFSGAAAGRLGNTGGPMERTAKAVETLVENTRALRDAQVLVTK